MTTPNNLFSSEFFAWMGFTNSASSKETMTTDAFGMHKVIVCMCANGKIVGLHSNSGRVVYGVGLDSEEFAPREETPLIVSRSAAHFPHEPTVYAFGTSQQSGEFVAWTFNPITGKAEQAQGLPSNIVLISSLGHHDHSFARPILLLSDDDSVHVLPATADAHSTVQQMIPNLFLHSVDMNNGLAQGYEVISKDSKLYGRQSWSVGINTETDTIVAVSRKPQYEKNPLQFQMIGDAQEKLLYKYLNKNQMAMATLSNTGLLTILLLDTVTGNVIQRLTHRDAAEPVHVVQWVNNVVYTYQNIQEQRTEVVSMSLFESSNPDSRQEFESSKSTQPIAIRQAMVLGATVDTLAVAQTAQGLASNTILFGLRTGGLLSLSEKLLDPRRPVGKDAKPVLGLTPYTPLIPMLPINLLNYYHRIHRFTAVRSASTLLESRAVVFAHGLDMFSCSITPAGSFDQLGEEFNRPFLLACLIGITVAAGITEYFAREKKLKQKWK
ncbi:hypothetical protein SARC_03211 [Sphaeroforma arctica JP610]|uniref:ER membrane protein complex subunit 1 n=1 Tax=Sphaeroforma arctica JP610 TaxID=667725 RepID=A0A0L0G8M2_9EUKA|nr:hypothetical protein SARC_03211 [Sphaeroforma arctica JP610]KNC84568.1 hypothetical protein SARC_03211 [Sphaeroforma arctica JP610]|eukprot:XP_014158470.1 hypothetical protein SARC_03211 [Sphaeroforma arctica JP610]